MSHLEKKVFISHSSADAKISDSLYRFLEQNGVGCWMDMHDLTPGIPYAKGIMQGLHACEATVILISAKSIESDDVLNEIDQAHAAGKILFPVFIEDVKLPHDFRYYLARRQWVTAYNDRQKAFEDILAALVNLGVGQPGQKPVAVQIEDDEEPKKSLLKRPAVLGALAAGIILAAAGIFYFLGSSMSSSSDAETQITESVEDGSETNVDETYEITTFFQNVYSNYGDYYGAVVEMVENNFSPAAKQQLRDLNEYEGQNDYAYWRIDGSSDGGCPSDMMTGIECKELSKGFKQVTLSFQIYDPDGAVDGFYDLVYLCSYDHEARKVIIDSVEYVDPTM